MIDIGLKSIKQDPKHNHFKHHSILIHKILFCGQETGMWFEDLRIRQRDKEGTNLSIQLWTSIWDSRYNESHYVFFEDFFVKTLYRMFEHPCDYSISYEINKFLRPKEFYE